MSEALLKAEEFLTSVGQEAVKAAIRSAERLTSGEIRVHLDDLIADEVLDHAAFVFEELNMHLTKERNGVLFYVSVVDHKLAVIGDKGINEKVEEGFWNDVLQRVQEHFKAGAHSEGLVAGIQLAGEKLSAHFPYQGNDSNELSDDISFGS